MDDVQHRVLKNFCKRFIDRKRVDSKRISEEVHLNQGYKLTLSKTVSVVPGDTVFTLPEKRKYNELENNHNRYYGKRVEIFIKREPKVTR